MPNYNNLIINDNLPFVAPSNGIVYCTLKYHNTDNASTEGHGGSFYINGVLICTSSGIADYNNRNDTLTFIVNKGDILSFIPNTYFGTTNKFSVVFIPLA